MKENCYKMFPEINFAIVRLQTEILYLNDLEELNYKYKTDINYSNIHYLLIIIDRESKLSFSLKELSKLSESYNREFQQNNHRIIVWLVAQPVITALTHLFVLRTKDNSHYCSTVSKAYEMLDMPVAFGKFEELIKCQDHE